MSRTHRNRHTTPHGCTVQDGKGHLFHLYPHRFRRHWSCVEKKKDRKAHNRRYRARVRAWLHRAVDLSEEVPEPRWRRTSGWWSW